MKEFTSVQNEVKSYEILQSSKLNVLECVSLCGRTCPESIISRRRTKEGYGDEIERQGKNSEKTGEER